MHSNVLKCAANALQMQVDCRSRGRQHLVPLLLLRLRPVGLAKCATNRAPVVVLLCLVPTDTPTWIRQVEGVVLVAVRGSTLEVAERIMFHKHGPQLVESLGDGTSRRIVAIGVRLCLLASSHQKGLDLGGQRHRLVLALGILRLRRCTRMRT